MIEWIITSCALIVIVLLLRLLLKGKISLRLQYGLWLLVLIRLLIPVNFLSSPISVMNAVSEPKSVPAPVVELPQEITHTEQMDLELPQPQLPQVDYSAPTVEQTPVQPTVSVIPDLETQNTPIVEQTPTLSLKQILLGIWLLGMAVCCAVIAAANIRFALGLKRSRQKVESDCRLPVYSTGIIDTPCLFGIFCPAIYLTAEELEEGQKLHVLTHELTHSRHLDHIWALLRSLCLVLHWYNPLVWVAAVLSRRDAELACDEATIRRLGEDCRAEYGKTLIRMTCAKQELGSILTTATTMTGSKKIITQRIKLIAKHPKTAVSAAICLILVAAIAVGCTFTGANQPAPEETTPEEATAPEETTPEETTAPVVETVTVTDKRATEVLSTSYKLKDLRAFMDDEEMFYTIYSSHPSGRKLSLSDVHDEFPIECFKGKYIIYSVEEGGYFYVFPDVLTPYEVGEQVVLSETNVADTVYVSGVCDLSDFDSIEVGKSTFQDVKDIDPNIEGYYSSDDDYDILRSHSPLSDGRLLDISYKRNDDTNSEIVVDMQINPINYEPSPYWWTRIQYEDWPRESGVNNLPANTEVTLAEYLTQNGLDINAPYLHFTVNYEGRNYYFSSHNDLFMYDWNFLVHSSFKPKEKTGFDDSLDYICIYIRAAYGTTGTIYINKDNQLRVGEENYYRVRGLYSEIKHRLSFHTEKSDRYFEIDETGPTTTYTVYGFDKVNENNRRPYYLYLTDDNFVYVWSQYGTGTMARMSKFYDPETGRVSPAYTAPTDYYQNMVVCYYDPETRSSFGSITIVDMFSGQVLYKVDEKYLPADRDLALGADTVYFNYDGSQIILEYYTDGFEPHWHTINIPTEVRLNRTVSMGKSTIQLPEYSSGTVADKTWENPKNPSSNVPVADQQVATEIAEAVVNAHFPGYKATAAGFHPVQKVWVISLSNGSKGLMVAIRWDDAQIQCVWETEAGAAYQVGTTPWENAKNLLSEPYISNKETAGLVGEAIRASWSRQGGLYYPHSCVQSVFYEESEGYWLILLYPHRQYPADEEVFIAIDESDGRVIKIWHGRE